jgi:protein-S-isoprenylcysteine O-methyltransferase Ste14
MANRLDTAYAGVRPPIAWAIAVAAGLVIDWFFPYRFFPAVVPRLIIGAVVFLAGAALIAWAIVTLTRAGTQVPTTKPTTLIVAHGPYRFSRNPIYVGFCLCLIGLGIGLNNAWLLFAFAGFFVLMNMVVIEREERYLTSKFGTDYVLYKKQVRRWL